MDGKRSQPISKEPILTKSSFGEPTKVSMLCLFTGLDDIENLKTTGAVPGKFPFVRGTKADNVWFVRQEIVVTDAKEANAKALDILNKGVDSIGFKLDKKDLSPAYIETLLEGIAAECVELNFSVCSRRSADLAKILTDYYKAKGYDVTKLHGSINWDGNKRHVASR